jgi:hypothetical protein
VYNHYGNVRVDDCTLTDNLVYLKGGAIYNHYGHVDINASHFHCNLARWESYEFGELPITKFLGRRAIEINDLDRSGNAVYHRYSANDSPDAEDAALLLENLALRRPTLASSLYFGLPNNASHLAVDGDSVSRAPPHIYISNAVPQPSWWGVHLASPTTNPTVHFYASDCCAPQYHQWAHSPQAGTAGKDLTPALQQVRMLIDRPNTKLFGRGVHN